MFWSTPSFASLPYVFSLTYSSVEHFTMVYSIIKCHLFLRQQWIWCFIAKHVTFRTVMLFPMCLSDEITRIRREEIIVFAIRGSIIKSYASWNFIKWIVFLESPGLGFCITFRSIILPKSTYYKLWWCWWIMLLNNVDEQKSCWISILFHTHSFANINRCLGPLKYRVLQR